MIRVVAQVSTAPRQESGTRRQVSTAPRQEPGTRRRVLRAAGPVAPQLAPGQRLDGYELLCPVASGGTARVWAARRQDESRSQEIVAIKATLPSFADDKRFRRLLLASCVEHRNVAQIFDVGEAHGVFYTAMEYVDGDTLSSLIRACRERGDAVPTAVVLRLLADVCAGLHQAHELTDACGNPLGIVHGEVSPGNILVGTNGVAKLINFGIGFSGGRDIVKGSASAFVAPEQGLGGHVDRRADIWSVGATLHSLVAGIAPPEGENLLRPPALRPDLHPAIASIVRMALASEPENRYQTAAHLREALDHAIQKLGRATTTADVAGFFATHGGAGAEMRRRAIELALIGRPEGPARSLVIPIAGPRGKRARAPLGLRGLPEPPRWLTMIALALVVMVVGIALGKGFRQSPAGDGAWLRPAHAQTTTGTPPTKPPVSEMRPNVPLIAANDLPKAVDAPILPPAPEFPPVAPRARHAPPPRATPVAVPDGASPAPAGARSKLDGASPALAGARSKIDGASPALAGARSKIDEPTQVRPKEPEMIDDGF